MLLQPPHHTANAGFLSLVLNGWTANGAVDKSRIVLSTVPAGN